MLIMAMNPSAGLGRSCANYWKKGRKLTRKIIGYEISDMKFL
jgi:hypothetical protein